MKHYVESQFHQEFARLMKLATVVGTAEGNSSTSISPSRVDYGVGHGANAGIIRLLSVCCGEADLRLYF